MEIRVLAGWRGGHSGLLGLRQAALMGWWRQRGAWAVEEGVRHGGLVPDEEGEARMWCKCGLGCRPWGDDEREGRWMVEEVDDGVEKMGVWVRAVKKMEERIRVWLG